MAHCVSPMEIIINIIREAAGNAQSKNLKSARSNQSTGLFKLVKGKMIG